MPQPARDALKTALTDGLKSFAARVPGAKAKKLSLVLSEDGAKQVSAQLDLVFLTRVDAIYLQVHVAGGWLSDEVARLNLPLEANNLLAKGVFFLSTLSEKNSKFTPEVGGAKSFQSNTDVSAFSASLLEKLEMHYLPIVRSILDLSRELPGYVLQYEEFFSYPLAVLALLERLGLSSLYSERKNDPQFKGRFKKERRANVEAVLSQMF